MAMKFNQNTNNALSAITKAASSASVDAVVEINIDLIGDMPGNKDLFGYNEEEINALADEIRDSGFHGVIDIVQDKDNQGRYICVSGHQRLRALRLLNYEKAPCHILRGMSEQQIADYHRSANVLHRELSPLRMARLVKSYYEDYERSKTSGGGKIVGGKVAYAASKMHIGQSQVKRYYNLLSFPEDIQTLCDAKDFPYTTLLEARDFSDVEVEKLSAALKKYHHNGTISSEGLRKIIRRIEDDRTKPEYADIDPVEEYREHTGEKSGDTKAFVKSQAAQHKEYYNKVLEESDWKPGIIDEPLQAHVDEIYEMVARENFKTVNRTSVNRSIYGLEQVLKILKKDSGY